MSFYDLSPEASTVQGLAYASYLDSEAATPLNILNAQQQASRAAAGLRQLYSLVGTCMEVTPDEVEQRCGQAAAAVYSGALLVRGEHTLAASYAAQTGVAPALFR